MNGVFPEGEFSISTTEPLLDTGADVEREARFGLPLESVAEILARKLLLRMYGNGDFVSRDFYDLCTASERDGASLERALSALPREKRGEISREISGYGPSADRLGRPLTEVHRPEWLPDLARLAARIVEHGPERPPAAAPRDAFSLQPATVDPVPSMGQREDADVLHLADDVLVLSCAVSERVDAAAPLHRATLQQDIEEVLRTSAKADDVPEAEVAETAFGIAQKRPRPTFASRRPATDAERSSRSGPASSEIRTTRSSRTSTPTRLPWPTE